MESILAYGLGIFIIFILGKILLIPMKILMKLIINGISGGILLFLINIVGSAFGLNIEITPLNAIISGVLGVPGVILLLLMQ